MTTETNPEREEVNQVEKQIEELSKLIPDDGTARELERLKRRLEKLGKEIFAKLTPWQKVKLAKHPQRPYVLDYLDMIFEDFMEVHGDRRFADELRMAGR